MCRSTAALHVCMWFHSAITVLTARTFSAPLTSFCHHKQTDAANRKFAFPIRSFDNSDTDQSDTQTPQLNLQTNHQTKMSSAIPTATSVVESAVIRAPLSHVWHYIKLQDFSKLYVGCSHHSMV